MPVLWESEKAKAASTSSFYKCILVDSELEDKDIRIKIAYNMVDHYVLLCKDFVKYVQK